MRNDPDRRPSARSIGAPTVPEGDPEVADLRAMAARILGAIEERGWADVRHPLAEHEFEAIARRLGTIELRSEIVVDPGRDLLQREARDFRPARPSVYQDSELELHTDRPSADWLAWYCVRQDPEGGATLLVDTRDLTEHFSRGELEHLGRIDVGFNTRNPDTGREIAHRCPLLERGGPGLKVYYVPWLVEIATGDEEGRRLLDKFDDYVREKKERDSVPIRLEEGQSLFVDNRRLLHGRGPLSPESRRHLVRVYIRTPATGVQNPPEDGPS